MERNIDLTEISDGRLYTANDMVKIGCGGCAGCSECCKTVADTILLDPYDIFQLEQALHVGFDSLLASRIELSITDGIILPHLIIRPDGLGCTFLDEAGRCSIHDSRPGFCRMFPMGRIYEDGDFKYFLQVNECSYPDKTKVKLKKWLGIPGLPRYEQYIKDWHFFLKDVQRILQETDDDTSAKNVHMHLLNQFFVKPYDTTNAQGEQPDFYAQFDERLEESRRLLGITP